MLPHPSPPGKNHFLALGLWKTALKVQFEWLGKGILGLRSYMFSFYWTIETNKMKYDGFIISYGTALTWTLLLPVWKVFTLTQNHIYASDTSRNPLQSCLVFHSIFDLLLKTSFWANFYSSYYIILSYLVRNSIQRNMNRGGEKCIGAGWEKSPLFTKITREMNQ